LAGHRADHGGSYLVIQRTSCYIMCLRWRMGGGAGGGGTALQGGVGRVSAMAMRAAIGKGGASREDLVDERPQPRGVARARVVRATRRKAQPPIYGIAWHGRSNAARCTSASSRCSSSTRCTSSGGLSPNRRAFSHRCKRVWCRHGPNRPSKSNATSFWRVAASNTGGLSVCLRANGRSSTSGPGGARVPYTRGIWVDGRHLTWAPSSASSHRARPRPGAARTSWPAARHRRRSCSCAAV
jgi:hypothetical protein